MIAARTLVVRVGLAVLAAGCAASGFAAQEKRPWTATLMVSPKPGVSRTTRSGNRDGLRNWSRPNADRAWNDGRTETKTIDRSMKWEAVVRFRGKELPQKAELALTYVGYRGKETVPVIFKQEKRAVTLSETGRAVVEFESPVSRLTKTRTSSSSGNYGGFVSSRSQVRGERIAGCIAQLYADGELVKAYASDSRWEKAAKTGPITSATLNPPRSNRL